MRWVSFLAHVHGFGLLSKALPPGQIGALLGAIGIYFVGGVPGCYNQMVGMAY